MLHADSMQHVAMIGASASLGFVLIGCGDSSTSCTGSSDVTAGGYDAVITYTIVGALVPRCCDKLGADGWGNVPSNEGCQFCTGQVVNGLATCSSTDWDDSSISSYRRTVSISGADCSGTSCTLGNLEGTAIQVSVFGLSDSCCDESKESWPEEAACVTFRPCEVQAFGSRPSLTIADQSASSNVTNVLA